MVTAIMADQFSFAFMDGKRDVAMVALHRLTAVATDHAAGKTTTVQENQGLLTKLQGMADSLGQLRRKKRRPVGIGFYSLQINDFHFRHRTVFNPLRQAKHGVFFVEGMLEAGNGRGGCRVYCS